MVFKGKYRFSDRINFQISEEALNFESLCQFVEQENRRCLKENSTASVNILAIDKKNRLVYERGLTLPFESEVEMELLDFFDVNSPKKKRYKPDKIDRSRKQFIKKQSETNIQKRLPKKKSKRETRKINTRLLKVTIFVAFIFLVLGGGYLIVSHFIQSQQVERKEVTPSLTKLLEENKYLQSAKLYPHNLNKIESDIFQTIIDGQTKEVDIQTLKSFQKKYPTIVGTFDIAFLEGDYKLMVQTYMENKDRLQKDEMRMNLVGYAYLKIDNLDKAKEIANQVDDVALAKKIATYELYTKQLNEKEKFIENKKPSNEDELKQYNKTLDEIYDLKQKINNL